MELIIFKILRSVWPCQQGKLIFISTL